MSSVLIVTIGLIVILAGNLYYERKQRELFERAYRSMCIRFTQHLADDYKGKRMVVKVNGGIGNMSNVGVVEPTDELRRQVFELFGED
ncbi:hypothetical protein [Lactiplantibacillus daowaiensis]|uniref:hypothetical protein n=1 Tax=Lactiplantibacillus daowaiensis TaxID=2559918 RepID=UPI0010F829BA|nr:hypothetical protein [Lactiplantibacillus daowaiensis]